MIRNSEMETCMHQRSMLNQPKTTWICSCGSQVFEILLCPKCKGTENSHIVGFQCVGCETVHASANDSSTNEEYENILH